MSVLRLFIDFSRFYIVTKFLSGLYEKLTSPNVSVSFCINFVHERYHSYFILPRAHFIYQMNKILHLQTKHWGHVFGFILYQFCSWMLSQLLCFAENSFHLSNEQNSTLANKTSRPSVWFHFCLIFNYERYHSCLVWLNY
jgi:hypothetical protein